jgi:lia operon protein LiaG
MTVARFMSCLRRPLGDAPVRTTAMLALLAPSLLLAQVERRSLEGQKVAVFNVAGTVRLERGSGRDVEVEILRGGRDAARLRIETGALRGTPTLRVIYPENDIVYRGGRERARWGGSTEARIRDDGSWGGDRSLTGGRRVRVRTSGAGLEAWADLVVRVPAGREVAAYLLAGELTARDVEGDLRLDVSAARVTADGTRGALLIDAGSGGVALRNVTASRLAVDNGSGGVDLQDVRAEWCTFDSGSGGLSGSNVTCERFKVDIGSGGVRVRDGSFSDVSVDAGSGGVSLELRRTPSSTIIDSGSGGVSLTLPSSLSATLDIDTGSGGISTDFAVRTTRMQRDRLQGTVGDGAARLKVETGSGSVRLRKGA